MSEDNPTGRAARPSATGKERIVSLDGIRAVALLIIMGYHFGLGWLQGGLFSLDIFYRAVGLPDHRAAHQRVPQAAGHQALRVLVPKGPQAPPRPPHRAGGVTLMIRFAEPPASTPTSG